MEFYAMHREEIPMSEEHLVRADGQAATTDMMDPSDSEALGVFNDAKITLPQEQVWFRQWQEACSCTMLDKAGLRKHATDENDRLLHKEMSTRSPVKLLVDTKNVAGHYLVSIFVNLSMRHWLGDKLNGDVATGKVFKVWIANFAIAGTRYMESANQVFSMMSNCISESHDCSCGLVICPNTGRHGSAHDDQPIAAAESELTTFLDEPELRLRIRKLTFSFDEGTILEKSSRACVHTGIMLVSNELDIHGHWKSLFVNSRLWHRRGVCGFRMHQIEDYCNPAAKCQKARFDPRKHLFASSRKKQELSGHNFWRGVRDQLWDGMGTSSADYAVLVDTHAFDGSIAEMSMRAAFAPKSKAPQEMTVMPVWAPNDLEGQSNLVIAQFLARMLKNTLLSLVRTEQYKIEGFRDVCWQATGEVPVLKAEDFKATFPSKASDLLVREDWLTELKQKLPNAAMRRKIDEIVKTHNEVFNHNERSHANGEEWPPVKRARTLLDAVEIPIGEGEPSSRQEFFAQYSDHHIFSARGHEFAFTSCGKMFLIAAYGDILAAHTPIVLIYGQFFQGEHALALEQGKEPCFLVTIKSADELMLCTTGATLNNGLSRSSSNL